MSTIQPQPISHQVELSSPTEVTRDAVNHLWKGITSKVKADIALQRSNNTYDESLSSRYFSRLVNLRGQLYNVADTCANTMPKIDDSHTKELSKLHEKGLSTRDFLKIIIGLDACDQVEQSLSDECRQQVDKTLGLLIEFLTSETAGPARGLNIELRQSAQQIEKSLGDYIHRAATIKKACPTA